MVQQNSSNRRPSPRAQIRSFNTFDKDVKEITKEVENKDVKSRENKVVSTANLGGVNRPTSRTHARQIVETRSTGSHHVGVNRNVQRTFRNKMEDVQYPKMFQINTLILEHIKIAVSNLKPKKIKSN
jgi:hypothetical protein